MADIDNFEQSWQGLTHGQVEDAIKAKVAALVDAIAQGVTDRASLSGLISGLRTDVNNLLASYPADKVIVATGTTLLAKLTAIDNKLQELEDQEIDIDLDDYYTILQVDNLLASKANSNEVVKSISVNGQVQQKDQNGNVNIEVDASGLTKNDISVESQGDGTVDINVKDDTYTINLNHTHENMAKLVVCGESDLPSTLDNSTIYGVEEDGEISMLYIGGVPFYGGGGDTLSPVLRQPADESTIDVGKIASGESSVSKTITVKGKNLTQALTVAITGTGYSVNKQSISAADANVGTTLTITCTNTDDNATGTLSLASSEISCDCDLITNENPYESLTSVKLTGTQWLDTGYRPKSNSILSATVLFGDKGNDKGSNSRCFSVIDGDADGQFFIWATSAATSQICAKVGTGGGTMAQYEGYSPYGDVKNLVLGNSSFAILVNGSNISGSPKSVGVTPSFSAGSLCVGMAPNNKILDYYDLTIYNVKIYERDNGVDTLVRDYVPKLYEGVPGLYDSITDTFISSETTDKLEYEE